jgi:hypothetical protein
MRGVSKRIITLAATAAIIGTLVVQPAVAAPNTSKRGSDFGAVLRKIIRALEDIRIIYPPG